MTVLPLPLCLPWAVHLADGVLTGPWLAGGFVVAGLLAALAAFRVRDEEVPRIALLTAAFFVASLIHLRLGPTSVHLLLNGLVGVLLGRRAALAIPVGLLLQAALLGHGGFLALGVNACVLTLPALLAGGLFALLHRPSVLASPLARSALVGLAALTWSLGLVFSVVLIATNRWSHLPSLEAGPALRATFHPLTLAATSLLALLAARLERGLGHAPEFPLGVLVGLVAVLGTLALDAVVLLWGGQEDWHAIVLLVFVAHLPVALLESVVLGFTVGFLARVKPEMLGVPVGQLVPVCTPGERVSAPVAVPPLGLFLGVLGTLLCAGPARAHRLEAECKVLPGQQVRVESWFDLGGDSPQGAKVQVLRPDGSVLAEGMLDGEGLFTFRYERAERLRVVVTAGAGHRKELVIRPEELADSSGAEAVPVPKRESAGTAAVPRADRASRVWLKDVLAGVGLLFGAGALLLGVRNARAIEEVRRRTAALERSPPAPSASEDVSD